MTRVTRRQRWHTTALLACSLVVITGRAGAQDAALTPAQFISELDRLIGRIESAGPSTAELARVAGEMPSRWRVEAGDRTYSIPAGPLVGVLRGADPTRPALENAVHVLDALRAYRTEAILFERSGVPDASAARTRLEEILSAREFRGIHGPSVWARIWQRVREELTGLLTLLFGASVIPTIGHVFVYALMLLAGIALAILASRLLRRAAIVETGVAKAPVPRKEWAAWLPEAEAAAARGAWREAVHAAYWCAVSWLEARGAWRTDRTRTPREYPLLIPDSHPDRATLATLTGEFERVWYGNADADAATFTDAMASLRKFGCPPA